VLVPLGFSPILSREPAREVSNVLPMLESTGAKMLVLEEEVREQLEAEGRVLVEKAVEHMLTCFPISGPQRLSGAGGACTHRRGQEQHLGGCQDCGCLILVTASRRIGLRFQLVSSRTFCGFYKTSYHVLLLVVVDLSGTIAVQGPRKNLLKNVWLIVSTIVAP
jgi:hypothetical protein